MEEEYLPRVLSESERKKHTVGSIIKIGGSDGRYKVCPDGRLLIVRKSMSGKMITVRGRQYVVDAHGAYRRVKQV